MTGLELKDAETTYRLDQRQAEQSRAKRNALVRRALTEGWTHQRIAEATGLTRARISQIKARG